MSLDLDPFDLYNIRPRGPPCTSCATAVHVGLSFLYLVLQYIHIFLVYYIHKIMAENTMEAPVDVVEAENTEPKAENNENVHSEMVSEILSKENQGIFSKVSESVKNTYTEILKGLYAMPPVNWAVGKMDIAYHEFFINWHESTAVGYKGKIDSLSMNISALGESKAALESVIDELKQQNLPGGEALQLRIKSLDKQKAAMFTKRDIEQTKLEARENTVKLYTNERDTIADRLIGMYNEKLEPLEGQLETIQGQKDRLDLLQTVMEIRQKDDLAYIENIDKKKAKLKAALLLIPGMTEQQAEADESIKVLNGLVEERKTKIQSEKGKMARRMDEINNKYAKVENRANEHKDKRDEFIRIKQGRPIDFRYSERTRETDGAAREEIGGSSQNESSGSTPESSFENERTEPTLAVYISNWNELLKQLYGKSAVPEMIDKNTFLKTVRLSGERPIAGDDFNAILEKYYKIKKIPTDKMHAAMREMKRASN